MDYSISRWKIDKLRLKIAKNYNFTLKSLKYALFNSIEQQINWKWGNYTLKLGIYSDLHIGKRMYRTDENNYNKFEHIGYRLLKQNVKALKNANPDLSILSKLAPAITGIAK